MKTLAIAALVAAFLAGPVLAQAENLPATSKPVATAAPNKTEQSKAWTVGQKVPSTFTNTSRFTLTNYEEYGLPKPNTGSRWLLVGDNAYLVRTSSDMITKIVGVTPKT